MNDQAANDPTGLEEWLEVATRGLCADARERVRREISDHHRSALEAALEAGASADAARHSALGSLGDAREVGRGLRRTNLTRFQAALVRDHRGRPSAWTLMLHLALLALGIVVFAAFAETVAQRTVGAASLALIVLAIAVMHVVAPRSYRRGKVRTAIMASAVSHWLLYASLCVGLPFCTGGGPGRDVGLFYAAVLALLLALYLPLIGKVRRLDPRPGSMP